MLHMCHLAEPPLNSGCMSNSGTYIENLAKDAYQ